ncbi:MAG: Holliday junction branch migration protein RuvA [Acidobacteria bacterium]|nr:Holliday junction branch migration protein RuvA [Acidobacteriota bacterium]
MISFVRGEVAKISLASVVIDVNGVGMLVHTTPKTLAPLRMGQEAKISTAMIVREDSMTLYGFGAEAEREVFETLLTVSGIGPRLALAVLSVLDPDDVASAVESKDGKALTKVPGIGPKVAARMVLELTGKLVHSPNASQSVSLLDAAWKPQVVAAMTSLGWSEKDAEASVDKTVADQPELAAHGNVAEILRSTLRWLGQDHTRSSTGARS